MENKYVTHYYRESLETGDIEELEFTPYHADEIRVAFMNFKERPDLQGINRNAALELVNKWNHSNRWRYRI